MAVHQPYNHSDLSRAMNCPISAAPIDFQVKTIADQGRSIEQQCEALPNGQVNTINTRGTTHPIPLKAGADVSVVSEPLAGLSPDVADWFTRRTWQSVLWTAEELIAAKRGRTVSVVLPALNEEATVGGVVKAMLEAGSLVDEVVVIDGGCTDGTVAEATAAGARVVDLASALPGVPSRPGKGEVLWRSLNCTCGDFIAFVDADLVEVGPGVVVGLLGPLLMDESVHLVKGFYRRPLRQAKTEHPSGGGRVTELMARPLLARFAPKLGGVVQPLGGEYAARRDLLMALPFAGGYGIEVALLMDTLRLAGLDAIAQVDLGIRRHRNRDLADLGVMASEILAVVLQRAGLDPAPMPVDLVQFAQDSAPGGRGWHPVVRHVERSGREPLQTLLSISSLV